MKENNEACTGANLNKFNGQNLQTRLAEYLICAKKGEQISNVRKLASDLQMSIGSVSTAMNNFEALGAITIQRQGHMGSYLVDRSVALLWNCLLYTSDAADDLLCVDL